MSRVLVPGTVRIGKEGVVSLARDLFKSPRLVLVSFNPKSRKMVFRMNDTEGFRVYKSSPGAQSGTFSMLSVLKQYGLTRSVVGHRFEAQVNGSALTINFKRRVYDGNGNGSKGSSG